MADTQRIKEAAERNLAAIAADPSIGRGTATTTVRVRDGLTVDVEDGAWKLVGDEGKGDGGNGEGPDPGVFGRAALGTCLAIGYMTWAAVRGVPIAALEVDVEADYDASGTFGIDPSKPAGWSAMRYTVRVESSAPASEIDALIEHADTHSSLLYAFAKPIPISRSVKITAPAT
jgi:uncharacterized OsmC-like protein